MQNYDFIIIGTGAGLMLADVCMHLGLKCALIEKDKFGGTCLTKGCIPSKMLVYPADLIREVENAKRIGLKVEKPEIDWDHISKRMWTQIDYNKNIEENLEKAQGLDVYKGLAEFTSSNTVKVTMKDGSVKEIRGKNIIVAAGARPKVPRIKGLEEVGYVTYESFFGPKFPKKIWDSLVIIGAGAIGSEFTHIFSAYGTKVSLLSANYILPQEEPEVRTFVKEQFLDRGVDVDENIEVLSVEKTDKGKKVTYRRPETDEVIEVFAQEILLAAGLVSNADILRADKANLELDELGYIKTNEYLETSVPNIYAIGDINGKYQFRHVANYEAEVLITNLFTDEKKKAKYNSVPWTIFTNPQVAHIGLTEAQVKEKGIEYEVATNHYSDVIGGIAMGYSRRSMDNGFIKVIVSKDKKILGVHVVGPQASILAQPFVYLMNSGLGYELIEDSMVSHPSLNELSAWVFEQFDL